MIWILKKFFHVNRFLVILLLRIIFSGQCQDTCYKKAWNLNYPYFAKTILPQFPVNLDPSLPAYPQTSTLACQ
jgi:hypothetical protein